MAAVDATWMPSWPRLEPTKGARPCLTRMCMRSSSALAMHIQRCSWRYSSRVALSAAVVVATPSVYAAGVGHQRAGDVDDLFARQAEAVQVLVVALVEVREVGLLGALLAQPLHLFEDAAYEPRLGRDA